MGISELRACFILELSKRELAAAQQKLQIFYI